MSVAIMLETIEADGAHFGVSYAGPNPESHEYLPCRSRAYADALAARINDLPACPACGSRDVLVPGVDYRRFTCDPCGRDFPEVTA